LVGFRDPLIIKSCLFLVVYDKYSKNKSINTYKIKKNHEPFTWVV
jgi:hypothetical protein